MANVFAHSLADDLSYEDIIDDVVIFSDGSVGIGYAIDTVYIDNMDLGELLTLERSLSAFLLGIDKDVSVQVQWRKVAGNIPALDNHLDSIETGDPIVQQMCENRHEFWSRRRDLKAVFGFTCEIWFRKMYPRSFQGKFNEIWDMGVDEDRLVVKYMKEQNEIAENFRALTERIMVPFKSVAGRGVHQMNADEIYFSIRSFLTGDYHNVYEYKYDKPLKERFRGIDVSRKWGYFTIGNKDEKIFSILSVRDLPDRSQMMLINYLLDIDAEFCITVNIAAIDQGIKKDQLRKQFRRQMSVLNSKIDPELGTQAGEVSQLLQELQSGSNDLMDFEMFITITESNLKKLDFIVKPVVYENFVVKLRKALARVAENSNREISVSVLGGGVQRMLVSSVRYVEIIGHNISYHTDVGVVQSYGTLKSCEDLLGDGFARCNSCYLVNLKYVNGIKGYTVNVDGQELKVSQPKKKSFIKALNEYFAGGGGHVPFLR